MRTPHVYPARVSSTRTGMGRSCAFCGSPDVVWEHPLAEHLVVYREYGKEHTLPSSWALCARCETIYRAGDEDAAVDVMRSSIWSWVDDDGVAECIRKPLDVFRRADLGSRRFDPEPSAVAEAKKQGFVPLRELTGVADDLGPLWPTDHSLWVDELGPVFGEDEYHVLDRWLVRSPWQPLSPRQAINALWRWIDQQAQPTPRPPEADHLLILEFFTLSEPEVLVFASSDS